MDETHRSEGMYEKIFCVSLDLFRETVDEFLKELRACLLAVRIYHHIFQTMVL